MNALSRLSRRERVLIWLVLPLLAIVAGYRLAWMPLTGEWADAWAEIAAYRVVVDAATSRETAPPAPQSIAQDGTPIATRVTRSARSAGIALRRLEPEGEMLRVALEDALYVDVIGWIATLEATESVTPLALEMDRRPEPGLVTARLTLRLLR